MSMRPDHPCESRHFLLTPMVVSIPPQARLDSLMSCRLICNSLSMKAISSTVIFIVEPVATGTALIFVRHRSSRMWYSSPYMLPALSWALSSSMSLVIVTNALCLVLGVTASRGLIICIRR